MVVLAKEKYGMRGREVSEHEARVYSVFGLHADERREYRRTPLAQRRDRSDRAVRARTGRQVPPDLTEMRGQDFAAGRHSAGGGGGRARWA